MVVPQQTPNHIATIRPTYAPDANHSEHPSSSNHGQLESHRHSIFRSRTTGFGNRHVFDDAPFNLWDAGIGEFRYPVQNEVRWIFEKYRASDIHVVFPDIIIRTSQPPSQIPLTVGCALARFIPQDLHLPGLPSGFIRPPSRIERGDILSYHLPRFAIPTHEQSKEIIELLSSEADLRAIHFLPPQIVVELDVNGSRAYDSRSLPRKAGGLPILYHESPEEFWKGTSQKAYDRFIAPTGLLMDSSDYLSNSPHQLSPGVCLSSAYLGRDGATTSHRLITSAGLLIRKGATRALTSAHHGFPMSEEVYHPSPTGRRIGQIVQRFPDSDIALVQLDPSVYFSNRRYFAAPLPLRLVPIEEIRSGDWFAVDGMSSGRVDLCARGRSWYKPMPTRPSSLPVAYKDWRIETVFSLFGTIGAQIKEGIRGAPIMDEDGRVGGFVGQVDQAGLWAHVPALDFLIHAGWSVV